MTKGPWFTVLLVTLAAGASFLAGLVISPGRLPPVELIPSIGGPRASPAASRSAQTTCPDPGPLRRRLEEMEGKYRALALAVILERDRRGQASPEAPSTPPPVAFPKDLPEAATPQHFKEIAKAVLPSCFPELQVQDAECSEYPCIAWSSYDAVKGGSFDFRKCDEWNKKMGWRTVVYGRESPDGTTGFFGLLVLPEDSDLRVAAGKRVDLRMQALAEAYGIPAR